MIFMCHLARLSLRIEWSSCNISACNVDSYHAVMRLSIMLCFEDFISAVLCAIRMISYYEIDVADNFKEDIVIVDLSNKSLSFDISTSLS